MEQWQEYEHWLHESAEPQFLLGNLEDASGWCGWWQWWGLHPGSAAHEAMPHMEPAITDFHV